MFFFCRFLCAGMDRKWTGERESSHRVFVWGFSYGVSVFVYVVGRFENGREIG